MQGNMPLHQNLIWRVKVALVIQFKSLLEYKNMYMQYLPMTESFLHQISNHIMNVKHFVGSICSESK